MRKLGSILIIVGAVLVALYALHDPMDLETALVRYGHSDGRLATTQEVLEAREIWSPPPSPSVWFLISGAAVGTLGAVIRRRASTSQSSAR